MIDFHYDLTIFTNLENSMFFIQVFLYWSDKFYEF